MGAVTVGVDIGQRVDPTAIVAAEEVPGVTRGDDGERPTTLYLVRHVERVPLGTSYPDVAARIADVCDSVVEMTTREDVLRLVLDATGVGAPVVDLLREALGERSRFALVAVKIVSTDRVERGPDPGELRVGKAYIVSRLQTLLQTGRVKLPPTDEAKALARELLDYELRVSETATVTAGAFRTGTHDDLATALGLAVLDAGKRRPPMPGVVPLGVGGTGRRWDPDHADRGATHATYVPGPTTDEELRRREGIQW